MVRDEDEYRRLLDSLARFYNSQITAHVGYLLTVVAVLLTSLAILNQTLSDRIYFFLAGGLSLAFFGCIITYSFARLQYWMVLSQIVWEHMGLLGYAPEHMRELQSRALKQRARRGGIEPSIVSMFEARLYVSQCYRHKGSKKLNSDDLDHLTANLRTYFEFEEFGEEDLKRRMTDRPYSGSWFWKLDKTWLLEFAYRGKINEHRKSGDTTREGIAQLLTVGSVQSSTKQKTTSAVNSNLT